MLYCVVLIVQFSSRNMSYCSGFHATACMDGWHPCSYCGYQPCATHLAWLCVDVWHMSPRTDSWERECVPPYELFSNLHVVWDDRYWPRSRTWISKCAFCESVTRRSHFSRYRAYQAIAHRSRFPRTKRPMCCVCTPSLLLLFLLLFMRPCFCAVTAVATWLVFLIG